MDQTHLRGEVVKAGSVSGTLADRLFALHDQHYLGADRDRFDADLAEKQWVILLRTASGEVAGFSTQALMQADVEGKRVRAVFSGDTVIAREHWGTQELVRAWCRFAGWLLALEDRPLYWFLISKGHRTYLYLPLFFRDFHPRHDAPFPEWERQVLAELARQRFGENFDACTGRIAYATPHDRLRPELDSAPERPGNPHVRYFLRRNPQYGDGVELACLAEIRPENMRGMARRELERGIRSGAVDAGSLAVD